MRLKLSTLILLCLVGSIILTGLVTGDNANPGLMTGPNGDSSQINPEFITYTKLIAAGTLNNDNNPYKFGETPSPYYNPVKDVQMTFSSTTQTYPATFDLRTSGKVTSVKNQNPFGTCWAHATYGSLESTLKPGETYDFSEKNMVNIGGGDYDFSIPNGGGNAYMAAAYLTRWTGPVNEASDPYPTTTWNYVSSVYSPVKHVQKAIFLPARSSYSDLNNFKGALTNYGAVYSSFWYDDANYNSATHAYYEPVSFTESTATGGGHAVTIVGWDDNYASTNFATTPAGNGAWIVKNSWGTSWGASGYFYVSYYDRRFASKYESDYTKESAVFIGAPTTNYQTEYSYDNWGMVTSVGNGATLTRSFSNVFTVSGSKTLNAVGFYTTEPNAAYTISVYVNPSSPPVGGTPVKTFSGVLPDMGYNTVMVPSGVSLVDGNVLSIVAAVTNPTNSYIIPIQYPATGYSSHATGTAGHGYYISGSSWRDITLYTANSAICLKAFLSSSGSSGTSENIGVFRGAGSWYLDHDGSYSWTSDDCNWIKSFGLSTDIPVVGDWNGDGKKEIGVYRGGTWYLDHDGSNSWTLDDGNWIKSFGLPGDIPVVGDWNGDGIDQIGVFRSGTWYLDHDQSWSWTLDDGNWIKSFGLSTDKPVIGDWDGDRIDQIGVYRSGLWCLDHDQSWSWTLDDGNWMKSFGLSTDKPVVGDWNGDRIDQIGVFRSGLWYLDHDQSWSWTLDDGNWIKAFGLSTDKPVVGEWSTYGVAVIESVNDTVHLPISTPKVETHAVSIPKVETPVRSSNQPFGPVIAKLSQGAGNPLAIKSPIISP